MIELLVLFSIPLALVYYNYSFIFSFYETKKLFNILKFSYIYDKEDYQDENELYMLELFNQNKIHVFKNCTYKNKKYDEIILYYGNILNMKLLIYDYDFELKKFSRICKNLSLSYNKDSNELSGKNGFNKFYNLFLYKNFQYKDGFYIFFECIYNGNSYEKIEIDINDLINLNNFKSTNDLFEIKLINYNYSITFYLNLIEYK